MAGSLSSHPVHSVTAQAVLSPHRDQLSLLTYLSLQLSIILPILGRGGRAGCLLANTPVLTSTHGLLHTSLATASQTDTLAAEGMRTTQKRSLHSLHLPGCVETEFKGPCVPDAWSARGLCWAQVPSWPYRFYTILRMWLAELQSRALRHPGPVPKGSSTAAIPQNSRRERRRCSRRLFLLPETCSGQAPNMKSISHL